MSSRHPIVHEIRESVRLALPLTAAQLAQVSMGFVDTVMLGRLGPGAIAAGALGGAAFFPILILTFGFMFAVGPMVSQAYGAGDHRAVGKAVRQGLWLATILAVPAMVVLHNLEPFLRWTGQDPEVARLAQGYLSAISWGFLPNLWFTALRNFVEGLSRPRVVMFITMGGVAFNVTGNYVLMFGKLGFPAMGVVGTGVASAAAFWAMFVALALYAGRHRFFRSYAVFSQLRRPDPHVFRELIRIGWPIAVLHGLEVGLFATTAFLMGRLGTTELAAHQIAIQCASVTFMVPLGVSLATSVRVGQAVGRREPQAARRAGFVGIGLGAAFMTLTALSFWAVPGFFVGLYLDVGDAANAAVVSGAVTLLGIAAFFQIFDGVQVTSVGALRGLKDTRVPMVVGLVAYWFVGMTAAYAFGFGAGWGAPGLWWGLVLGLLTAATLLLARFVHRSGRLQPGAAGAPGPLAAEA